MNIYQGKMIKRSFCFVLLNIWNALPGASGLVELWPSGREATNHYNPPHPYSRDSGTRTVDLHIHIHPVPHLFIPSSCFLLDSSRNTSSLNSVTPPPRFVYLPLSSPSTSTSFIHTLTAFWPLGITQALLRSFQTDVCWCSHTHKHTHMKFP